MKKFVLKVACFILYAALIGIVFPYCLDPYNVFHTEAIRDNGVEPNKNYVKMSYILKHPDKFDAFLFGSSRVGAIHTEKMEGLHCYNMTYSAGIPEQHLRNLETMIANHIIPKKVFIGVDSISYTFRPESLMDSLHCPYEYLSESWENLYGMYLNTGIAVLSLPVIVPHQVWSDDYVRQFYENGAAINYAQVSTYDWEHAEIMSGSIGFADYFDETIGNMRDIAALCKTNGIELIVFTNPMHPLIYEASLEKDWFRFLEELAQVTDYYNFSGLNSITLDNANFLETSHYMAEIGDRMMDCFVNGNCDEALLKEGFGMKVTKDNVQELLRLLESQLSQPSAS